MNFLKNLFYTLFGDSFPTWTPDEMGCDAIRCKFISAHHKPPLCTYVHLLQVALERALGTAGEAPAQCGAGLVPVRAAGRARGARAVLRGRQEEADTAALTLWLYKVRRAY